MFLALDDELLKEYFAFMTNQRDKYDKDNIIKLFKYLQPFIILRSQKEDLGIEDALVNAYCDDGFMTIINDCDEETLIKNTKLKIMLTKDRVDGSYPYPYINILDDEIDMSFTATYKSGTPRDKAIEHIRALLLDANEISIYDKYFSYKKNWKTNRNLVNYLCSKALRIKIYADKKERINKKNINIDKELFFKKIGFSKLVTYKIKDTIHDRYIETDKVIILLSSGLYYLIDKDRDFTYILKVK